MTRVIFENATIRDAIGKAARIAPTKGSAFDKAAGILLEVDAAKGEVVVKATNTEVFYLEIVDVVEIVGDSCKWLIPSAMLDGICSKLPVTSGANATFEQKDSQISISHKRMKAAIRLQDPSYYPIWEPFDPTDLSPISGFGARMQQVQWAASKTGMPPLTGINLNGDYVRATDTFRVAIVPCEIPQLYDSVTIPAATFTPLMKSLGEVRLGRSDRELLVMPDETTQIKAIIYQDPFPDVNRVMKRDEPNAVMLNRDNLLEMIEQAMVMGMRDRTPVLKVIVGLEEVAVYMEDQEMGLLGNVMDVGGQATHDRHYIGFTPENLRAALQAAPNNDVTFWYHEGKSMKPVRLDGGSGYEVLIMPRSLTKSPEE